MKKTNKISNTSKKAIRYMAMASGLMAASLPGKANAEYVSAGVGVGPVQAGVSVGGIMDGAANIIGSTFGGAAQVIGATGVAAGNIIGATGVAGAQIAGSALSPVGGHACLNGGCNHAYTGYNYAAPAPTYTYTQGYAPAPIGYNVAVQPTTVRYVRTYRPAPVGYATVPVATQGERVEVQTYDHYSRESVNSKYNHSVQKRYVEDPANGYREQEVHSRKIIRTRRAYYTY